MFKSAMVAIVACTSVMGVVGCQDDMHHDKMDDKTSMDNTMPKDANTKKADDMISQGQDLKNQAAMMSDTDMKMGMSKQDMMTKGQKMIDDGNMMKQRVMNNKM